ncbi:TRAP transporter small permease [Halomonas sp. NO4]|uniref:TRAP transporter small permease n=1 Tax=Halomonas sp. NO4 TaxID=2484813 RepID=UPI0013D881D1|nr:TRAP transporter small permease [Halomonas sp. NO4]
MSTREQGAVDERRVVDDLDALSKVPKLPGRVGWLIGWSDRLFTALATLALLGIAATVMLQIAGRLFLPFSPAWTEELSRYLFIYMVALSSGAVIHRHRHVSVELFQHWLGPRGRALYQVLVCLVVGAFALIVLPYAWAYAENGAWQTSPTLKVPMLYIFFSTVVLFALVLVYSVIGVVEGLVALVRGPIDPEEEAPSWK